MPLAVLYLLVWQVLSRRRLFPPSGMGRYLLCAILFVRFASALAMYMLQRRQRFFVVVSHNI